MLSGIDRHRLDALERTTQALATRLQAVEERLPRAGGVVTAPDPRPAQSRSPESAVPAWPAPTTVPVSIAPPQPDAAATPAAARPRTSLEDVVGGRVLAWAGGLAVLVGIALLLAIAVSNGLIGEGARTLLAGAL
ncbi:MAG: hypothetical protein ACRDMZ_01515 [Solirubrobacteraceae bacterium]